MYNVHGARYHNSPQEQSPTSPSVRSPRANYPHPYNPPPTAFHHPQPPPAHPSSPTRPSSHQHSPYGGAALPSYDKGTSYYDPTAEHRRASSWNEQNHQPRSPDSHRHTHSYPATYAERRPFEHQENTSPTSPHRQYHPSYTNTSPHGRPVALTDRNQRSPTSPNTYNSHNMGPPPTTSTNSVDRPSTSQPARITDPMSFSNILASPDADPPTSPRTPRRPPSRKTSISNHLAERDARPPIMPPQSPSSERKHDVYPPPEPLVNGTSHYPAIPEQSPKQTGNKRKLHDRSTSFEKPRMNGVSETPKPSSTRPAKVQIIIPEKEYQAALARLNEMDESDVETGGFEEQKVEYSKRSIKRAQEAREEEQAKRKRRRIAYITKMADSFSRQASLTRERYHRTHEQAATQQVQMEEVAQEKERKKIMQRNRRREATKQKAEKEAAQLKQKAQETDDRQEKEKLIRDAQRAEKKATDTGKRLNGETPIKDIREATPLAPNLEGGVMSSFQMGDEANSERPAKKPRIGGRLKKSKEQKQAEKDAAAAAYAAGEDLVPLAPKTDGGKTKREPEVPREATPVEKTAASTKAYDQMYEAIWKDIARKDVPKVCRIKQNSTDTKVSNLRKTAVLASKEARRWQIKTNKSTKDTQARAKRVMREMLSFWKRNERDERDQRKLAEKAELDKARQAEKEREDNRQKRKLNFLISQTELYSHFIGKKVRTDEVERSTDDVAASGQKIKDTAAGAHEVSLPDSVANTGTKVTNFEDLDFDAEDESVLQEAAMANAQNAIQEAQDRARAFNEENQIQSQFDDGEMNFQNPTSLQSMDLPQPKMLACQLKEYQLKGLNWLVNLYEQGINGILADEMGLGKTVQSISVMAYLAEMHNIWGPFLIIAPSSTLHNWQQEITRFVPGLKVLPYWGNAKDRKVLRKYWDRKHITYNKDSSFHVLVTSYQLVVQDTQYFQKVRWQYMILDEAQAIKSAQSSRWKCLLGFHCRNRLLLTGTPIQNNMQELWALLHFIMPSLFDSHDEFSDWFSKDIESHAQSNTKLNEDQLKRLHMILKPFMLRRIKKHVQKELGDKIEEDVFCDLTYRQRAYYSNLRNKISIMDLIEKAAIGDDQDTATLMNLVMQFRKVCNHPDLFERAETTSPVSFAYFAETASFLREGHFVDVGYPIRNLIEFKIPRLIGRGNGRLNLPGPDNESAGWKNQLLYQTLNVYTPEKVLRASSGTQAFSWLPFTHITPSQISSLAHKDVFQRAIELQAQSVSTSEGVFAFKEDADRFTPASQFLDIVGNDMKEKQTAQVGDGVLHNLMNVSSNAFMEQGLGAIEPCSRPAATAPPVEIYCASQGVIKEKQQTFFNVPIRSALFGISEKTEQMFLDAKVSPKLFPVTNKLPPPISEKGRYNNIRVPSMRRFVTDSGKLAKLDELLGKLKEEGHRVLLYFQMTRMIDLMEEYLTYRNYKYCRLDGSTKLEDRRDTVADFQSRDDIFVFLLSTRAGGLGINLTAADTVIFYDSDWNPTIDSQAMDRAHRLGQTRQVTVYRMITRGTIEERIRKRALQKEEVQRVVIQGGAGATVDFNARSRENRTKDIAMWLADDDQAAAIEEKEKEIMEKEAKEPPGKKNKKKQSGKKVEVSLDDMYHEGEGHFDDSKVSGAATPVEPPKKRKGTSKKAKTVKEKLAYIDGGI